MNRLNQQRRKAFRPPTNHEGLTVAVATLIIAAFAAGTHAAEASGRKTVLSKGGISPNPVVTSVTKATNSPNSVKVEWQGFGGPYQVVKCPSLKASGITWDTVATITNSNSATLPIDGEAGFIAVQGPDPVYSGAERCITCHADSHDDWVTTRHARALESLKRIKQDKNPSCLGCHTVGYGTSTGFIDEVTTPQFAGVQCENCHGPVDAHAARPLDKRLYPVKTLAAEMCGGCHTDAHHPTYDEWATSGHGSLEIPHEEFADPVSGPPRMATCGACHSGATRMAMLKQLVNPNKDPEEAPEMPTTHEAAGTAITCAVCHNAHADTGNPAQLWFPVHSKTPYSYTTSKSFAANFNPEIQTCAQCHNDRGATWQGTSRPPHHSPQYNMLIGSSGFTGDVTEVPQSAHMNIEKQCSQCHTHPHGPDPTLGETVYYTGHTFHPSMQGCAPCHDEVGGALLAEAVQHNLKQQIAEVKALLDQWALTKAPEALREKYGALAWEFQNIGQLSTRTPEVPSGPTGAEQAGVPDGIKQARFNLYLVEHDGSYGVHNGNYARFLLKVARDKINAEP